MNILIEKSKKYQVYGLLPDIAELLGSHVETYDWFLSDIEIMNAPQFEEQYFTAEEFKSFLGNPDGQIIWGVLSALPKGSGIPEGSRPTVETDEAFWRETPKPQLPNAALEVVVLDSSSYLILGCPKDLSEHIFRLVPDAMDLDQKPPPDSRRVPPVAPPLGNHGMREESYVPPSGEDPSMLGLLLKGLGLLLLLAFFARACTCVDYGAAIEAKFQPRLEYTSVCLATPKGMIRDLCQSKMPSDDSPSGERRAMWVFKWGGCPGFLSFKPDIDNMDDSLFLVFIGESDTMRSRIWVQGRNDIDATYNFGVIDSSNTDRYHFKNWIQAED